MGGARVYVVTVVAEGPVSGPVAGAVDGGVVRFVLGARRMYTPEGALSWLREQAHRVADGLDPDPYAAWLPAARPDSAPGAGVLVAVAPYVPDVPTALRNWCDDHRQEGGRAAAARRRGTAGGGRRRSLGAVHAHRRAHHGRRPAPLRCAPAPVVVALPAVAPLRAARAYGNDGGRGTLRWLEALAVTLSAVLGILVIAVMACVRGG
ncbi:hypothetical protein ACFXKG_20160 [Streptomyces sp. NPDC059255]|uniref:hypothetical protein n=1 Tax=Streptomyces sp. NPDC059255 TaxID=3346793 RepID=UPI00369C3BFA